MSDWKNLSDSYKTKKPETIEKSQGEPVAQKQGDEDEGGSGGSSKGMLGSYKKEKLFNLIGKGVLKAEKFGNFLNKDYLDKSELKKTELTKDLPAEAIANKEAVKTAEEANKLKEKFADKTTTHSWNKESDYTKTQTTFLGKTEDSNRRAIAGDKLQGSIIGAFNGNPLGFAKQGEVGAIEQGSEEAAESTRKASRGDRVQGAVYSNPGDHLGIIRQGWMGTETNRNNQAKQKANPQNPPQSPGIKTGPGRK